MTDYFDTTGTLFSIGNQAKLNDSGDTKWLARANQVCWRNNNRLDAHKRLLLNHRSAFRKAHERVLRQSQQDYCFWSVLVKASTIWKIST